MQSPASAPNQMFDQLQKSTHEVLKSWHSHTVPENNLLEQLHLFRTALQQTGGEVRRALDAVLRQALTALEAKFAQDAMLLRRAFLENEMKHKIATDLHIADATLYRWQNEALTRLTAVLLELEEAASTSDHVRLTQRLKPPTYQHLIGVEPHLDALYTVVVTPGSPWLIALEGMGGIGKTSLADALMRRMIDNNFMREIGWITAQREFFNLGGALSHSELPALSMATFVDLLTDQLMTDSQREEAVTPEQRLRLLQQLLKSTSHLIVVDNLETVADLQELLPVLRTLADPTKFVLTSRQNLYTEADIYHFPVPELSEGDALALIRQEATQRNLEQILAASDEALRPILATVGGNPLALRLVVGQTHTHGLNTILADLTAARGGKAENLYHFIYRRAWEHLGETERKVLLAMPLVAEEGGDLAYLQATSQIPPENLGIALDHLVALNLVDSIGGLHERRYSIHNLTRTFLHEQVIRWH
ncbi:MAG: NB-ARC domain-containing protein [Caldilineaceae bacterium]